MARPSLSPGTGISKGCSTMMHRRILIASVPPKSESMVEAAVASEITGLRVGQLYMLARTSMPELDVKVYVWSGRRDHVTYLKSAVEKLAVKLREAGIPRQV